MEKFVGILGGMGTDATTYFYKKLMELDVAENDQDHLKIMLYNNSKIPDRTNYILYREESPLEELLHSSEILESTGVDFITLPCNTAHCFYDDLNFNLRIPLLNIVYEVILDLTKKGKNKGKIGLIATKGTIAADVYKKMFKSYDLEIVYPLETDQDFVNDFIYRIKMKKKLEFEKFNNTLKNFSLENNLDVIILGCTELSLVLNKLNFENCEVIDSNYLLANRTYIYAKGIEDVNQVYKTMINDCRFSGSSKD